MTQTSDSRPILRLLTAALGAGAVAFGAAPLAAPRVFAAALGLPHEGRAAASVAMRSVGVRDLANGIGLLTTLDQPEQNAVWLVLRCASDTGDAVACWLAVRDDPDNWRLKALASIASGAALWGGVLLWCARKRKTASA